jgi:hypothetical protein
MTTPIMLAACSRRVREQVIGVHREALPEPALHRAVAAGAQEDLCRLRAVELLGDDHLPACGGHHPGDRPASRAERRGDGVDVRHDAPAVAAAGHEARAPASDDVATYLLIRMLASGLILALADAPTEVHQTTVAKQVLRGTS